jgi:hypothetical protein
MQYSEKVRGCRENAMAEGSVRKHPDVENSGRGRACKNSILHAQGAQDYKYAEQRRDRCCCCWV